MTPTNANTVPNRERPRWPLRLQEVCRDLQSPGRDQSRDTLVGEAWVLIKTALMRYLHYHSSRLGKLAAEDLDDLGSEKAFDLLCKIELGEWNLGGRSASEIQSYLSHVARNGLVNAIKKSRRQAAGETDGLIILRDTFSVCRSASLCARFCKLLKINHPLS